MNYKHYGTQVTDNGIFCSDFGKSIENRYSAERNTKWVYTTFEKYPTNGEYLGSVICSAYGGQESARILLWSKYKQVIFNVLQPFLDNGWQPVTELNSSCLVIESSTNHSKGATQDPVSTYKKCWLLVKVRVLLRLERKSIPVQTCTIQ
ncbi:MAG: hypothetical protein NT121_26285 [Chloroflexi bacterium]|nr:hypothetical protein [Chloroflexota bacterium]